MSQTELIRLHDQFVSEMATADTYLRGHYQHLLLSLGRLIESHGPTREYTEWFSSTAPTQFSPPVLLGR